MRSFPSEGLQDSQSEKSMRFVRHTRRAKEKTHSRKTVGFYLVVVAGFEPATSAL
jgi:hypothetical protein